MLRVISRVRPRLASSRAPASDCDAPNRKYPAGSRRAMNFTLRSQKALMRQWEELPLTESVNLSVGVFGQSFLTGEPRRLMQGFLDRKK